MHLCIYEDAAVVDLEPLTLTHPAFDLWCGSEPLWRRQLRYFGAERAHVLVRQSLAGICGMVHPDFTVNEPSQLWGRDVVLVNARWLPPPEGRPDLDAPVHAVA